MIKAFKENKDQGLVPEDEVEEILPEERKEEEAVPEQPQALAEPINQP